MSSPFGVYIMMLREAMDKFNNKQLFVDIVIMIISWWLS